MPATQEVPPGGIINNSKNTGQ